MSTHSSASLRTHHSATSTPACNRSEVVGFVERRRKLWPFTKTLEVTHPTLGTGAGSKSVIVIDLDELGTTGSSQNGAVASASVGVHIFLSGLTVLAFYGTYSSVEAMIGATRDLRTLSAQQKVLRERLVAAGATDLTGNLDAGRVNALRRALRENDAGRAHAHVQRILMGGFGGTGATLVGTSILANAKMLGAFAPTTLAMAASPLMFAAAPIVAIFGTGIATYEAYKFARTLQTNHRIPRGLGTSEAEQVARTLLEKRLRAVRIVRGLKVACYLGLAVGVPCAVFGGPYGLPIMVVSAGGMVVSGVLEGVMTGYQPQLDLEERLALKEKQAVIAAVNDTHRRYDYLNRKRHEKITQYPHGIGGNALVRQTARGVGKLRRLWGRQDTPVSARRMVLASIGALHDFDVRQDGISITSPKPHIRCCTKHQVATLMDFLVRGNAMRAFGGELLAHKSLRADFAKVGVVNKVGKEWHFDAKALVQHFATTRDSKSAQALANHTFEVAEKVLLTAEPKRLLWRERQLLDMLADEVRQTTADVK